MNSKIWTGAGLICLMLLAISGCREHPRVTSRESLDLIKQVYTACNTRNPERLNKCKVALDELVSNGEISEAEQQSFEKILKLAEAGEWQAAQSESLQFARDQVRD